MVLPVAQKKAESPEPEPSPLTYPVSIPPAKVCTTKSFVFTPQKTSHDEKEKADTVKEVDTAENSLQDSSHPLVLSVAPIKADTPEPEPSPYTPQNSTPKNFGITTQTTSQDKNGKADTVKEVDTAEKFLKDSNLLLVLPVAPIKADTPKPEPSPYTPQNSTPNNFVFTTQTTSKDENEVADTVERPTAASHTPAPSHPAPAGPSVTVNPTTQSVPVVPKVAVPSQTSTGTPPVSNIPAPSIPAPIHSTSASPEPKIP
ncbi:cell surface glycoprotein 1-like [Cyprinus carpio]|uniref:Cell surface glycoprotein 1-like n=1 Tax=Cyprinus carpio TaxID=7962 RepID=A0A9Q9Z6X8_CYPCA|nr:cell surface glycoprotein 1-like [Cyprinus carpio]